MDGSTDILFDDDFEEGSDDGDPDYDYQSEQQFMQTCTGIVYVYNNENRIMTICVFL